MKLKDYLYEKPELTEEKIIEEITSSSPFLPSDLRHLTPDEILKEFDLISEKRSNLTKSRRDIIQGIVTLAMIKIINDGGSQDTLDPISET